MQSTSSFLLRGMTSTTDLALVRTYAEAPDNHGRVTSSLFNPREQTTNRRRRNVGDNAYTRGLVKVKVGLVMVANTTEAPVESVNNVPAHTEPILTRPYPATPAFPPILSSASPLLSLTWDAGWVGGAR